MDKKSEEIIKLIQDWREQSTKAIPESNYYYYCYGIEMGLKLALQLIEK